MKEEYLNYLTKTPVSQHEVTELDFDLKDEFFPKSKKSYVEISNVRNYAYGDVINLDVLISKLQEMKEEGATHVEIEHNQDHLGYEFIASKFHISTQEEIDEFKERKAYCDKITLEIQEYQSKIEALKIKLFK